MLLYFSATGNGKYLADRLYGREPQEQKSIPDCMRAGEFSFSDESSIGLIVPTYNFGPPSLVLEFLKNASFETPYLYLVASYGRHSESCDTGQRGRRLLFRSHAGHLDADF